MTFSRVILSILGFLILLGTSYEVYKRYLRKLFVTKKQVFDNEDDYVENLHDKNERTSYNIEKNNRGEFFEKRELAIQIINTRIVRLDENGETAFDRRAQAAKKKSEGWQTINYFFKIIPYLLHQFTKSSLCSIRIHHLQNSFQILRCDQL